MIRRPGAQDATTAGNTEMVYVFSAGLQDMERPFNVLIVVEIS